MNPVRNLLPKIIAKREWRIATPFLGRSASPNNKGSTYSVHALREMTQGQISNRVKEFNLQTGRIGEAIAKEFLKKKGYEILEQNYRTKYAEIDLLAKKNQEIILVEVRTKIGENFGSPEESLTKKKLKKLWFNAQIARATRIDAVCIVLKPDGTTERIEHYENII